ncbi:peptide chain release factor PrfB3, chloroplastic isoform X1 [Canna indica]|uniref:Peptide chain release factor PrfB3, chloroplastic isoform X1 n=1 Tax=Canna indica TaxID=4628 RepID=A0AAQ3KPI6_9LILI|nr:peptide chain release factor PrfB3, chloroplastic isoform X1 [Canna indica]
MSIMRSASFPPARLASPAPIPSPVRASLSMDDSSSSKSHKAFKQLGLYSLKKKIEDVVSRAEMVAPTALEMEEASRIKHEEVLRGHSLWDDLDKSDACFTALADAIKIVNDLKDLRYKAEEAKLIMELAETDAISQELFKQAYKASLDVNRSLERYEIVKLLSGPYDKEGACLIIKAGSEEPASEVWTEKLLRMYTRWAEKHGCSAKIIERYPSKGPGTKTKTIEFESEYMYGYLSGERGVHRKICSSSDGSSIPKMYSAIVDVIPLFLGGSIDMQIDDNDMEISYFSSHKQYPFDNGIQPAVNIHHIPSGIIAQSSGERNSFANKIKALNRLKAKLLVLKKEHGALYVNRTKREAEAVPKELNHETRRYIFHPHKVVEDVKTGIQLPDLNSILNGNVEPLMRAHISLRQGREHDGN